MLVVPEKQLSDEESSDTWESTSINTYKTNTQYRYLFEIR